MTDGGPGGGELAAGDPASSAPVSTGEWEGSTAEDLRAAWSIPGLRIYASVGSTNDEARAWAAAGAPEGAVVLAEEQRTGRGRVGRRWTSPAGLGLWISMVARPSERALGPLPILVGVELAAALDPWAGPAGGVRLKWPNDLLLDGRKMGGILCEAAWAGTHLDHVIIGIGLNLLHHPLDFPADLRDSAVSLAALSETPVSRFDVATAAVRALRRVLAPDDDGLAARAAELAARDALRGHRVEVTEPESGRRIAVGIGAGIDAGGALLLDTQAGLVPIHSGTVRRLG